MNVVIPKLSISATSITSYKSFEEFTNTRGKHVNSLKNLNQNRFSGGISFAQRKKISSIIENLHLSMNFDIIEENIKFNRDFRRLTFITLTLSQKQIHDDYYIKRYMLNNFIKKMKEKKFFKTYLWRAESQKNGNIHFHMVTNEFIEKEFIQEKWNEAQKNEGYLTGYNNKFNTDNAPSTLIHYSYNLETTVKYTAKYVAKKETNRLINGRLWGCSDNLKELKTFTMICNNDISNMINNAVDMQILDVYSNDYCVKFSGNIMKLLFNKMPSVFNEFKANCYQNSRKILGLSEQKNNIQIRQNVILKKAVLSKNEQKSVNRRLKKAELRKQLAFKLVVN